MLDGNDELCLCRKYGEGDILHLSVGDGPRNWTGLIEQVFQALQPEALAPFAHGGRSNAQSFGHRLVTLIRAATENDTSAHAMACEVFRRRAKVLSISISPGVRSRGLVGRPMGMP